jgi:spectinomycin phosphotransferase
MLEPPAIPIEYITSCLQAEFGLSLKEITFLPLGYDVNTAVYRAITMDNDYFVKLRRGEFNAVTVELPYFLCSQGVPGIVPPIKSTSDRLFGMCGEYTLILYPYIAGQDGYQVQLEPAHWSQQGDTLRRVHSIQLPAGLVSLIPKETYNPAWRADTRHFLDLASRITYTDPVAQKVIRLLITRRPLILHMVERAEILAHSLDDARADRVLCHSDAHLGNFLVSDTETVYLVDWDNPIFAPRERDLMFFGTGMFAKDQVEPEKTWFYNGLTSMYKDGQKSEIFSGRDVLPENHPLFYAQYTCSRIRNILRQMERKGIEIPDLAEIIFKFTEKDKIE